MTTPIQFAELPVQERWRKIDFLSDLHLKAEDEETFRAWMQYMLYTAADAVFILGDLFEFWVGDDCATASSFESRCGDVLRAAGASRDVFFMPGNRDFLVGNDFLQSNNVKPLLADPTVLVLDAERRYLLTHGDQLCADDVAYQQFRLQVRSEQYQKTFMSRPLAVRQEMARQMRARSDQHQAAARMRADISIQLAHQWLADADSTFLIHGHTHRPGFHEPSFDAKGRSLTMAILSDWRVAGHERRAEVLRLTPADGLLRPLPSSDAA